MWYTVVMKKRCAECKRPVWMDFSDAGLLRFDRTKYVAPAADFGVSEGGSHDFCEDCLERLELQQSVDLGETTWEELRA